MLRGMIKTLKAYDVKIFIAVDNAPRPGILSFSKKDIHEFLRLVGYKTTSVEGEQILRERIEGTNEILAYKRSN